MQVVGGEQMVEVGDLRGDWVIKEIFGVGIIVEMERN